MFPLRRQLGMRARDARARAAARRFFGLARDFRALPTSAKIGALAIAYERFCLAFGVMEGIAELRAELVGRCHREILRRTFGLTAGDFIYNAS
jgi:hypothetical protein